MQYCRITLQKLTEKEQQKGYSAEGIKLLTGSRTFNPMLDISRDEFAMLPKKQQGMSISGYQPKFQLIFENGQFNSIGQQGTFILKPSPADYPYLAENEHSTMQVMRALGFNTPANGLLAFKKTNEEETVEYAYVIKRFDRDDFGNPIHQEQLDGAMNIAEKYGKIGSDDEQYISYERIVKFILKHIENNLIVKQDLFRRVVYAYLLGNNDLHLRNFSLIYTKTGKASLTPIYDFVSVAPYKELFNHILALPLLEKEEGGKELAHGFNTKYGEYIGQDFIEFGEAIGLSRKLLIEKMFPQFVKEQEIVKEIYQRSFVPTEHQEVILKSYIRRLGLLQVVDEVSI